MSRTHDARFLAQFSRSGQQRLPSLLHKSMNWYQACLRRMKQRLVNLLSTAVSRIAQIIIQIGSTTSRTSRMRRAYRKGWCNSALSPFYNLSAYNSLKQGNSAADLKGGKATGQHQVHFQLFHAWLPTFLKGSKSSPRRRDNILLCACLCFAKRKSLGHEFQRHAWLSACGTSGGRTVKVF